MRNKLFVFLFCSCTYILAGCAPEEPTNPAEFEVANESATEPDTDEVQVEVVSKYATGQFTVPDSGFRGEFTLTASEKVIEDLGPYTPNYPPMPAIIDELLMFQVGGAYRILLPNLDVDLMVGSTEQPVKIEFYQADDESFEIWVDGVSVASGSGPLITMGAYRLYSNGGGRDWQGHITGFQITDTAGNVQVISLDN